MSTAIMNQVYNHAITSYYPKVNSRYDTHKKSELRSVYNNIVKVNKESPVFLLKDPKASRDAAIHIKESSRSLHNAIAALGGFREEELLDQKVAFSSNENVAQATYIGNQGANAPVPTLELEVLSLAKGQVNLGKALPDAPVKLPTDTYSFDISIDDLNYEFQFSIKEDQTNKDLQERIARLIQNADIGLNASVKATGDDRYALEISSVEPGLPDGKNLIFKISDNNTSKQNGTVDYFGLNYVSSEPDNAHFMLNGEERSASANEFTVGKTYELHLTGITPEGIGPTTIGLKTDVDSFTDNVGELIGSYNSFIENTRSFAEEHPASGKLIHELKSITAAYAEHFSSIGLDTKEDGSIDVNESILRLTAGTSSAKEDFLPLKSFASSLVRKTSQISLDPMNYVDKTIVAYKKPGNNLNSPYVSSAYSGMFFNMYY